MYDNLGQPKNQKDIDIVLKKKYQVIGSAMISGGSGLGTLAQISGAPANSATAVSSLDAPQGKMRQPQQQ